MSEDPFPEAPKKPIRARWWWLLVIVALPGLGLIGFLTAGEDGGGEIEADGNWSLSTRG